MGIWTASLLEKNSCFSKPAVCGRELTYVKLSPAMASAANASGGPTGDLRAERGDDAGGNAACRRHVRFAARDALLVKAGGALFAGKLGIAEGLCRQCLK